MHCVQLMHTSEGMNNRFNRSVQCPSFVATDKTVVKGLVYFSGISVLGHLDSAWSSLVNRSKGSGQTKSAMKDERCKNIKCGSGDTGTNTRIKSEGGDPSQAPGNWATYRPRLDSPTRWNKVGVRMQIPVWQQQAEVGFLIRRFIFPYAIPP